MRAGPARHFRVTTSRRAALVLNLGRDHWVAFDTDLLACLPPWRGKGLTARALAPGSYHQPDRKTPGGQVPAPEPEGPLWVANGIYPGWQIGAAVLAERSARSRAVAGGDRPRSAARTLRPIQGRAARARRRGARIHGGRRGRSRVDDGLPGRRTPGGIAIVRHFDVGPSQGALWLVVGYKTKDVEFSLGTRTGVPIVLETRSGREARPGGAEGADRPGRMWVVRVLPHDDADSASRSRRSTDGASSPPRLLRTRSRLTPRRPAGRRRSRTKRDARRPRRTPTSWTTSRCRSRTRGAATCAPATSSSSRTAPACVVTLDGDVWLVRGLHEAGRHGALAAVRVRPARAADARRFATSRSTSSIATASGVCATRTATARPTSTSCSPTPSRRPPTCASSRTRSGSRPAASSSSPRATSRRRRSASTTARAAHLGRRPARDDVLGYGFRQPNIGVNIRTGLVTASDQQGNYIPTTPLHIVARPAVLRVPERQAAARGIPRADRRSAHLDSARGQRVGDVAGVAVRRAHGAAQRRARAHRVQQPRALPGDAQRAQREAAGGGREHHAGVRFPAAQRLGESRGRPAVSRRLPDPRAGGRPRRGSPGLGRVRYTGAASTLPREVVPMDKGVLAALRRGARSAQAAANPDNYSLTSWHYKRTYQYGSPQFKADGTPGIDRAGAEQRLSLEGSAQRVRRPCPGMKPVMQMRLGWSLATADGRSSRTARSSRPTSCRRSIRGRRDSAMSPSICPPRAASAPAPRRR